MSLLVTGSIAIDTVKTPYGVSHDCPGGSAVYFSMAASFFFPVRLVGVIGSDCPFNLEGLFAQRPIDLTGLEIRKQSKTFRWTGRYTDTMSEVITESKQLNVLAESPPKLPPQYKDSKFIFLANTAPALQLQMLEQLDSPAFVAADTMNCWINDKLNDLKTLLKNIDCLVINQSEAAMLAGFPSRGFPADAPSHRIDNDRRIIETILEMGPDIVVIKKGSLGSIAGDKSGKMFILPAFPVDKVKDPTGAGDSFAGGLMGHLAATGKYDFATLKTAIAYGTVVASFTIADFSLQGLTSITKTDIDNRFETLRQLTQF